MPKPKEIQNDPRQLLITSYFPKNKGPLRIECKNVITSTENQMILKKYRARNRKRKLSLEKVSEPDNDVEYISTEKLVKNDTDEIEDNNKPLSPNVTFSMDLIEADLDSNIDGTSSSSISQKIEASVIGDLTVTKSKIQAKEVQKKGSKTLQMTQSHNLPEPNADSDVIDGSSAPNSSETPSVLESTDLASLFLEVELLDDNENIHKIMNHIELINEIIENTTQTYLSNLLFENEKDILEEYQKLTVYEKYFCCKLFTHQIKWYNAFKFTESIHLFVSQQQTKCIVECLADKSILKIDYSSEEIISLLNFLCLNDVKYVHDALRLKTKHKSKPKLIASILNYINNQSTLHPIISMEKKVRQMVSDRLGEMVQITPLFYTAFYKVHLAYTFTNPELGVPSGLYLRMTSIKYGSILHPPYIRKDDVVFENAEDYADFYKAFSYKNEVMQALEKKGDAKFPIMFDLSKEIVKEFANVLSNINGNISSDGKPSHLKRFTAGHQYAGALWLLSKHLGHKYPNEAREWLEMLVGQTYFYQRKRGLWYVQLSLVYNAHLREGEKAVETLVLGLKDKLVSLCDMSEIVYRARSYCKKKKLKTEELSSHLSFWDETIPNPEVFPVVHIRALANNSSETVRQGDYKYMTSSGDTIYMNVEEIAIRHYRDNENFDKGVHCEGALMQTIFNVLFWDVIFTDGIPHTFISKMQSVPLDFYSPEFYHNRRAEIDRRLSDVKTDWSPDHLRSYLVETWNSVSMYKTLVLPGFISDGENLFNIVTCVGRSIVSDICYRLVENFRDHRAGMPDLFVYSENTYKFVEVKGPGDKLSPKQKLWIHFLLSVGANAEVCYVSKIGANQRNQI